MNNTQAKQNCRNYSQSYAALIDKIHADPVAARHVADSLQSMEDMQSAVVDFTEFSISPWPVIISRELQAEFDHFIKNVGSILYRAIQLYFGNDSQRFSNYFGEPDVLLDMLNNDGIDIRHLMSRHDVMLSGGVPKLLEANTGSTLGGWELNMLQDRCIEALNGLNLDLGTDLKSQHVLRSLFNYLAWGIAQLPCENKSGNIVFTYINNEQSYGIGAVADFLQSLYESTPDYVSGRVIMTSDVSQIDIDVDGTPTHSGERFNAVLMPDSQLYESMRMPLTACMLSGHLVYPDCPLYTMASYKAVIGLCHDSNVKAALTDDEARFVDRYIPFTTTLEHESVLYQGKQIDLSELLLSRQDEFVIKKSDSLAGRDVLVGCFTDAEDWQLQVEALQGNAHWVAQEYCPPDKILAPGQDSETSVYDPVWGIFAVHNQYSGAFVRAVQEQKSTGVINSATGALEFVVLEEMAKQSGGQGLHQSFAGEFSLTSQNNTKFYSQRQFELMEALSEQVQTDSGKDIRAKLLKPCDFDVPSFAHHGLEHYPLNPWPVIINQNRVEQFNLFTSQFDVLLNKVLPLYLEQLDNPQQAFFEYFNEPEMLYDLWQENDINLAELLVRYDAVFTNGELRLVEINCGSALGGWEMEYTQPRMLSHVSELLGDDDQKLRCRPFLDYLFDHLAKDIATLKSEEKTGHVLFVSGEMPESSVCEFEQDLQQVYGNVSSYEHGRVIICTDITDIVFHDNGAASFRGEFFNAVIMPDMDANNAIAMSFTSSAISGHLVCPDSPVFRPFGSKAFMALLHEPTVLSLLTAEERDFISSSVPYTVKLDADCATYEGKQQSVAGLLKHNQQQFVIKKCNSSQGADVLIGRFMSEEDWEDSLDLLLGNGHWVAQQFSAPDTILSAESTCVVNEFDPVWGIFAVNGEYAGAYVRTKPAGSGVINTACGAVMVTVMEVNEPDSLSSSQSQAERLHNDLPLVSRQKGGEVNKTYSQSFAQLAGNFPQGKGHFNDVMEDYIDGLPGFVDPDVVLRLPLIISSHWVNQFEQLTTWYPEVVSRAIKAMFNNADEFSSTLNESPLLYEMLADVSVSADELLMRFDLYHQHSQAKMLEVNVGTVCGGWDSDIVWHSRPEALKQDLEQLDAQPLYRDICSGFIDTIIQSIFKLKGSASTGVILIGVSEKNDTFNQQLQNYLSAEFSSHMANCGAKGNVKFFSDMQKLQFHDDGNVLFNQQEVDALFVTCPSLNEQLNGVYSVPLTRAYASGALAFPDSPFHQLFGNKLLMALLHDYRISGNASAEDVSLISEFIPWSKQLKHLGEPENLSLLKRISENPEQFVLKKNKSSKGEEVYVGKNIDVSHWQNLLAEKMTDGDWLVQEFISAPHVCVPEGNSMLNTDMVWGVFGFAGTYCGNFVRIMPSKGNSVINSALGAKELLVLEEPPVEPEIKPGKEWIL